MGRAPRAPSSSTEAYQAVGLKLEDFEGPRYRRIDQIKQLIAAGNLGTDLRWLREPVAA